MIHAIILAGGGGRRFWPKSRKGLPKQLLSFAASPTPIQNLLNIIKSLIPRERIWVVGNKEYARSLRRQLSSLPEDNFLIEPLSRNTAAAVGWASMVIKRVDPQAVCIVLPSDILIKGKSYFLQAIKVAARFAGNNDALIAIGIPPQRVAIEYGYLKITPSAQLAARRIKVYKVERFVEKPGAPKARVFMRSPRYLWNAGVFVWRVESILQALKQYLPQLYYGLQRIEQARGGAGFKRQLTKEYRRFKDVSIDYGVMEKAGNIYTVPGKFRWQDLGSWDSLAQGKFTKDKEGNIVFGLHKGIDTCDSVIFGEKNHLIATLGLRNLIIVHTPSATLVCRKERAQEVKELTKILEKDRRLRKYL